MIPASEIVQVAQAGKGSDPAWYRVHRRLSIHVTALALRLGLHATACSLLMMGLAAAGAVAVAAPTFGSNALGFGLCYAAFLLDKVDGEVARVRGEASARGVLLDRFHHRVVEPTLFVAVAAHEYFLTGSVLLLVAGFVAAQLANAIEETQQLPPFILYKRAREGAPLPAGPAPALAPGLVTAARLLKPLRGFRLLIVALPLFALADAAEAVTGLPAPAYALVAAAAGLALYLVFQTAYYFHGRLDRELAHVSRTLRNAPAGETPLRRGG